MTESEDLAGRFITAAEGIKKSLERQYGQEFNGLGEARRHAHEKKNVIVRRNEKALKTLEKLRNVMQHSDVIGGKVLATPREDAVLAIEDIAAKIQNPPQIRTYMIKNPDVVSPTDSLARAAELVIEKGYSQFPVYQEGKYQGLFTTNALARWLSEAMQREEGILFEENVTVSAITEFAEEHEHPQFFRPTHSAYKVCDLLSSEKPVPAVLVTTDGKQTGELQGIVTRFDVPNILRQLTTKFAS